MKAYAISTGPDTHLDHLGVLAALLEIPLIVTDEKIFAIAKTFYPQIEVVLKEPSSLSLDFLAQECDLIFHCGKFWLPELLPLFELLYKKRMRFVFCPHGNSDKGHSIKQGNMSHDILLAYGDHMCDLLKNTGTAGKVVLTGNYRYPYYRKHQAFYDKLADARVFSRFDPKKKTILYAPTWENSENPSRFFEVCSTLISSLAPFFNLIIKLHPLMQEDQPARLCQIQEQHAHHPHVLFLTEFPALYPLLAKTDIYLGDFSSVGYDFLAFDKPMYFFSTNKKLPLHRCGIEIPDQEIANIAAYLMRREEENLSLMRQKTYEYAFGQERAVRQIKEEIANAYFSKLSGGKTLT